MTDPHTIARLRAEQPHAARLRAEQQHAARLGPAPAGKDADYWEPMPHMRLEDISERIREAEREAEWLAADDDRWPSGWWISRALIAAAALALGITAWGVLS